MEAVRQLATRLATVNVYHLLDEMFGTAKYQALIPDMVKKRLTVSGTYSTDKQIRTYGALGADEGGNYTVFTQSEKKRKGQIASHVTLKDTGQFYQSFNLQPKQTYAVIDRDENKSDGMVSDNIPELPEVFGLSPSEMDTLRGEVLTDIVKGIKIKMNA